MERTPASISPPQPPPPTCSASPSSSPPGPRPRARHRVRLDLKPNQRRRLALEKWTTRARAQRRRHLGTRPLYPLTPGCQRRWRFRLPRRLLRSSTRSSRGVTVDDTDAGADWTTDHSPDLFARPGQSSADVAGRVCSPSPPTASIDGSTVYVRAVSTADAADAGFSNDGLFLQSTTFGLEF